MNHALALTALVSFGGAPAPVAAHRPQDGVIVLTIRGRGQPEPVPARIEVRDGQGRFFVAEDAIPVGGDCQNHDKPPPVLPIQEALARLQRSVKNYLTKTEHFYSTGRSRLVVPAGIYDITVHKGPEFRLATRRLEVEPGGRADVAFVLDRWATPTREGWYSADAHLHIARSIPELNPYISKWMQAEDIHVANLLQWGHSQHFQNAPQYAHGERGLYREGDYILAAGQENPRTQLLGHTIVLGAKSPIHVAAPYLVYGRVLQEARRQGAVAGYAHGHKRSIGLRTGLAIDLPDGLLSFLEVLQYGRAGYDRYYEILNTGFRMAPIAGSDYPCGSFKEPWGRFYTRVDGPLTYAAWIEGVRRGRTYVTSGPLLTFRVQGKNIGDEVLLGRPGRVWVDATVRFDPERDDVEALELVQNGSVLRRFPRGARKKEVRARFRHEVREASWLAVRVVGTKVAARQATGTPAANEHLASTAHSGPIYVGIRGAPGLAGHPRAIALSARWLSLLGDLERSLLDEANLDRLASPQVVEPLPPDVIRRDRPALLEAVRSAKRHFVNIVDSL